MKKNTDPEAQLWCTQSQLTSQWFLHGCWSEAQADDHYTHTVVGKD